MERTQADEIIIADAIWDPKARERSLQLTIEALRKGKANADRSMSSPRRCNGGAAKDHPDAPELTLDAFTGQPVAFRFDFVRFVFTPE